MNTLVIDPKAIAPAWHSLEKALSFKVGTIHNKTQYKQAVNLMNGVLDIVGDNEKHELAGLLELLGQLVEDYEKEHHVIPDAVPREVLRLMMEQNGLKQTDLADEIGRQSVVSEILSGKRGINARQARALAARFHISAAAFI
ncbi:MAG: putative DNA-binding transcriptional regulator [Candidatus Gallionella acididurans]|uniref:Putative DNA-binding transcriptional regulator n=1 Tax=Candidatus Gallionella acididurans TaxID=1796491 RepID=A0A139BU85_9PROT|nr:MAG: putative DNA-binding transcriptional regulator [Candidatus Gallionella acididurans]